MALSDAEKTQRAERFAKVGWRLLFGPAAFAMVGNLLDANLLVSSAVGLLLSITFVSASAAIQGRQPARSV